MNWCSAFEGDWVFLSSDVSPDVLESRTQALDHWTIDAQPKSTQDSGSQASCLSSVMIKGMAHAGVKKRKSENKPHRRKARWGFSGKAKKHLTVGRIPRRDGRGKYTAMP